MDKRDLGKGQNASHQDQSEHAQRNFQLNEENIKLKSERGEKKPHPVKIIK